jgi:hypothetical protein
VAFSIEVLRRGFFDQSKVVRAVSLAKRKAFSKAGAGVRKTAMTSIAYKDGPAPAGQPPHAHRYSGFTRQRKLKTGKVIQQASSPLRELILFAYDFKTESVVVGPVDFKGARGPKQGPRLLEFGGSATAQDGKGRPKRYRFKPHPFMRPAMAAEAPKFAELFRGTIGG